MAARQATTNTLTIFAASLTTDTQTHRPICIEREMLRSEEEKNKRIQGFVRVVVCIHCGDASMWRFHTAVRCFHQPTKTTR